MIPCLQIKNLSRPLDAKGCPSAQNDHPLRRFRAKPFAFWRRLTAGDDPLDLKPLAPDERLKHLTLPGLGQSGENVTAIDF